MENNQEKLAKYLDLAIEILFYALVLFAPLFFDRRIGIVFSLSKATWIRALTLSLVGLWATKLVIYKGMNIKRTVLDTPVLTYLLCVLAASMLSINVLISWVGSYGRYEGVVTIVCYCLVFFLTTNFMNDDLRKRRVMMLSVIAAVVMSVYGIIQRLGIDPFAWGGVVTNERIIATIGQPNFACAYLDMAFFMGLSLFFTLRRGEQKYFEVIRPQQPKSASKKQKGIAGRSHGRTKISLFWDEIFFQLKYFSAYIGITGLFVVSLYSAEGPAAFIKWMAIFIMMVCLSIYFIFRFEELDHRLMEFVIAVSLICIFGGVVSTQSRGGWIGFLCGFTIFGFMTGRDLLIKNRGKILSVIIGLFMVVGLSFVFLGASQSGRFLNEVNVTKSGGTAKMETSGAAGSRIETWTSALRVIGDHPVLGIGPEVIKGVFPQYETELFRFKEAFHVKQDRCHNEILDMSVTRGILTLIVYLWLIGSAYYFGYRQIKDRTAEPIMIGGILAAMTAYLAQNQFSFGVVAITSFFWMLMGMAMPAKDQAEHQQLKPRNMRMGLELIFLMWAVILVLLYFSAYPYIGDRYFKSAQTSAQPGLFDQSFSEFRSAIKYSPYEGGFYTHYGMTMLNSMAGKPQDPAIIKRALEIFAKGRKVDPYNADNFYMAGRANLILNDIGAGNFIASAEQLSRAAIKIDPYYAESYQNLGYIYERRGDLGKAVEMYVKAFQINPTMLDVGSSIYRYYKSIGKPGEAFKALEEPLNPNPSNVDLLIMLGDFYRETGLDAKASEKYDKALGYSPNDVRAMSGKAVMFLQQNDDKAAFSVLQEAMMIDPASPVLHNGMGAYYLKTGDRARARQEFEQVISLDPGNQYARQMINSLR